MNLGSKLILKAASALLAILMLVPCALSAYALSSGEGAKAGYIGSDEGCDAAREMNPPVTDDFNNVTVLITIGKKGSKVNEIQLKLYGDYYFESDMRCISDSTDNPYTLNIINRNGTVYAYDYYGNLLTSGAELRLNKVYLGRDYGHAVLFTTGCDLPSYPYGTNNNLYLGSFIFDALDLEDGVYYLRMRNVVPLKYYTYGVIEHEMSPDCLPHALRAQAIAAKTFALSFRGYYPDYDVKDGYSDSMNQMYRGFPQVASRLSMMDHCTYVVGKALAYNGRLYYTPYGATNGGETTLPSMAYGYSPIDEAFAITLDDADFNTSPTYRKTLTVTYGAQGTSGEEFTTRFRDFILVKARAALGGSYNKVLEINSVSAFSPKQGTQRDMQKLSFSAVVVDTNSGVQPTADPDDPEATPPPAEEPVPVTFNCTCDITELKSLQLADLDGSGDSYPSTKKGMFYGNYLIYWGTPTSNGYNLYFCRYGHGVGMSQKGAEAMATPAYGSKTYEQILKFYYPAFYLVDINESDPDAPFVSTLKTVAYGHCTGASVNVRTGPSLTDTTVIGIAHTDEHLDIVSVSDDGGFYLVKWNGHMGYISVKYTSLDMFPSPEDAMFTLYSGVTSANAELYTAPTVQANVYAVLNSEAVTVWAQVGGWYYVVTANGKAGYLKKSVVTITDEYEYYGSESIPNSAPRPRFITSLGREDFKPITGRRRIG